NIPGQAPINTPINDKFLEAYSQYAEQVGKDAELVQKAAIEHNRRNHQVVMEGVLPEIPATAMSVRPRQYWEAMVGTEAPASIGGAYQRLLQDIGAGSPPAL